MRVKTTVGAGVVLECITGCTLKNPKVRKPQTLNTEKQKEKKKKKTQTYKVKSKTSKTLNPNPNPQPRGSCPRQRAWHTRRKEDTRASTLLLATPSASRCTPPTGVPRS